MEKLSTGAIGHGAQITEAAAGLAQHRRVGRSRHGVAPSIGDAGADSAKLALAADVLGQQMQGGAVDAGHRFDRPGGAAGHVQRIGLGGQQVRVWVWCSRTVALVLWESATG
ncbi:hypothetical protein D8B34_16965 [Verminephrobacter eiseniae]|nr:hypothetical protein [Verminephrobacter eiseniae]MCW8187058.1 hypothetical protein [Verminephrobacter eiseniae]MCW8235391.1 hypothetical protein [Verminephrobacter eiseniae]